MVNFVLKRKRRRKENPHLHLNHLHVKHKQLYTNITNNLHLNKFSHRLQQIHIQLMQQQTGSNNPFAATSRLKYFRHSNRSDHGGSIVDQEKPWRTVLDSDFVRVLRIESQSENRWKNWRPRFEGNVVPIQSHWLERKNRFSRFQQENYRQSGDCNSDDWKDGDKEKEKAESF